MYCSVYHISIKGYIKCTTLSHFWSYRGRQLASPAPSRVVVRLVGLPRALARYEPELHNNCPLPFSIPTLSSLAVVNFRYTLDSETEKRSSHYCRREAALKQLACRGATLSPRSFSEPPSRQPRIRTPTAGRWYGLPLLNTHVPAELPTFYPYNVALSFYCYS